MVYSDVNASPEPTSVLGIVICDNFHLLPEKYMNTLEITMYIVVELHVNIQIMTLRNQWYSWRKKNNAGTRL